MKSIGGILAETYATWSYSISQCCLSFSSSDEKPHQPGKQPSIPPHPSSPLMRLADHKSFGIIYEEPCPAPPPISLYRSARGAPGWEQAPKKRHRPERSSFSARRFLSRSVSSSSRRPLISAPTNFRHVHSESFRFPDYGTAQVRPSPASFRPLELSIYISDNRLSPILPHFDYSVHAVTPPQRAVTLSSGSQGSPHMSHSRSYSSMSFHIPRRPVNGGSNFDSPRSDASGPQPPPPARLRSYTSPESPNPMVEDLVERVANAMVERDRLQEQIEDVIERHSIYTSSRPSTAHGQPEMEPMPEIPALPPNAPSFSERLSTDGPHTAPSKPSMRTPYKANSSRKIEDRAPPPPLPLRLRPPLRKKKSFSRVSSWLFLGEEQKGHSRQRSSYASFNSITNKPMPLKDADGFYQIAESVSKERDSFDTLPSSSDWTVEEEQTVQTSLSPSSTATAKVKLEPSVPFLSGPQQPTTTPKRRSVGVAV
ncbi:hypothetical protein GGR52DRAFT_444211 [Hypoxylon sp. FL1284]|nr:hypothetical protein GGR52DRAFT_444211 [Hypoxylon sp. FL1284]